MASQLEPPIDSSRERIMQLFALQAQCSIWGLFLGGVWAYFTNRYFPAVFSNDNSWNTFGLSALLFLVALFISVVFFLAPPRILIPHSKKLLYSCSALCMFAICILILGTGGIHSPFTPFYIMTYTLTLERLEESTNKWRILIWFVLPIIGICLLERFLTGSLIETAMLNKMLADTFYYSAVVFGLILSMFVPTLSAWFEVYLKKARMQA